jgi:hypothetical protein
VRFTVDCLFEVGNGRHLEWNAGVYRIGPASSIRKDKPLGTISARDNSKEKQLAPLVVNIFVATPHCETYIPARTADPDTSSDALLGGSDLPHARPRARRYPEQLRRRGTNESALGRNGPTRSPLRPESFVDNRVDNAWRGCVSMGMAR